MRQSITIYPNKQLFNKAVDIPKNQIIGDTYRQIGASMLEILKSGGGIGLSANQVGLSFNMCVIELNSYDPKILINPRIIKMSDTMIESKEGCLSLPGAIVKVNRHAKIQVEYEDVTGETQNYSTTGLESCCVQHELDHLKGILMINRVGEFAKSKALKAVHRFKKSRNGRML